MLHTKLPCILAGLLLAGLLVAGCAEPDTDDSGAQGGTTMPTTLPGNPPATKQTEPAGQVTVTGTVVEGVEPDCLLLDAGGGKQYLLIGGDRSELQAGARVAVTGRADPNLLSTCQQGEPLVVSEIKQAP
ncbi:MAG TPA: hypothetical protein VG846_07945 [Actinomycetota bacterium]|nr:hypothetical protein [Actinomycetota bacterium]